MLVLSGMLLVGAIVLFRKYESENQDYFKNEKGNCNIEDYKYHLK